MKNLFEKSWTLKIVPHQSLSSLKKPSLEPIKVVQHSNDIQLLQSNEWDLRNQRKAFAQLNSCAEINDTETFWLLESSGGKKNDMPCIPDKNNNNYNFWWVCWISKCRPSLIFQVLSCQPVLKVKKTVQGSQLSFRGIVKSTTCSNRRFCIWLLC